MIPSCICFTVSADNKGQHVSEACQLRTHKQIVEQEMSISPDSGLPSIHSIHVMLGSPSMRNCWWSCSSHLETLSLWVVPCRWFRLHPDSTGLQERDRDWHLSVVTALWRVWLCLVCSCHAGTCSHSIQKPPPTPTRHISQVSIHLPNWLYCHPHCCNWIYVFGN